MSSADSPRAFLLVLSRGYFHVPGADAAAARPPQPRPRPATRLRRRSHRRRALGRFPRRTAPGVRPGDDAIETALRVKPDFAVAHLNRAVTWAAAGQLPAGLARIRMAAALRALSHRPAAGPALGRRRGPRPPASCCTRSRDWATRSNSSATPPWSKERCGTVILQCQKGLARSAGCRGSRSPRGPRRRRCRSTTCNRP